MAKKIDSEQLATEISRTLREYAEDVKVNVQEVAEEVSKETVAELKENSPERTGKYARHWTSETYQGGAVIYQKGNTYRLTHLLEKGHQLRRGGRKTGEVPSYPHIAPAEERAVQKYTDGIVRRLGR